MPKTLRRAPQVIESDDIAAAPEIEAYSPPDLDFYNKRDELLGENTTGTIRVYREGPGGYRDLTFVRSFSLTEFEPEMLQAPPFSGGRFRIHMLGAGQGGMRANFLFKVEPLPGAKPLFDPATLQPVQQPANDTATILAAMKDGFAQIAAAMQPQKHGMGVEEAIKLMTAISGMQNNNGERAREPSNGLGMIEQLSRVIEVIEDIRGPMDGDGKVSMLGVVSRALDKIAEPLGDVLATVAKKRLDANPNAARALAAAVATGDAAAPTTGAEPVNMLESLKMFLPMLVAQAAADNDPQTYADMLFDNVPVDAIRPWVEREDWFSELEKLDPRVAEFKGWFTELRDAVVAGLTPDPDESKKVVALDSARTDAPTGGKPAG